MKKTNKMHIGSKEKFNRFVSNWVILFGKFGIVGVVNNIVSLAIYYLVVSFNEKLYLLGNAMGFIVSTFCAYMLNSRFVFGSSEKKTGKTALVKTYATYMTSLCMSTLILYVLVQRLGISERIAPIFSLMITIPFNFLMNKLWVYKARDDQMNRK